MLELELTATAAQAVPLTKAYQLPSPLPIFQRPTVDCSAVSCYKCGLYFKPVPVCKAVIP